MINIPERYLYANIGTNEREITKFTWLFFKASAVYIGGYINDNMFMQLSSQA